MNKIIREHYPASELPPAAVASDVYGATEIREALA
jgi:hypothetical protein